jgi:serine/threonine-protein kinase
MSTPDWNELWSLFHRIVTLDQAKRKAALAELPAEQAEELESLLQAHDQDGSLLDRPVLLTQALQPGRLIGPWALQGLIGEGGMGQVWLARRADGAYEKDVAIKLLALGSPTADLARRFARERAILARLDHPNIARLLDGGTLDNGQPYLVMEHVEGQELRAFSQIRALSINQRVELMLKICGAVDHAHRRLIIHRDLKPANILVTRSGQPKLLDFGIARLLHPDADSEQTIAAERRLTLEYASPEQLRGDPVDTRSDAFSLGVILFELLVGQRPWSVEGCSAIEAHSRLTGRPPHGSAAWRAPPAIGGNCRVTWTGSLAGPSNRIPIVATPMRASSATTCAATSRVFRSRPGPRAGPIASDASSGAIPWASGPRPWLWP